MLTSIALRSRRLLRRLPLVLIGLLLTASTAMAGQRPPRDGFPPLHRLEKALSLTPEQTSAARSRKSAAKAANQAAKDSMRAKHDELRALWAAESPNRAAILAKMNELSAIATALAESRVDARLAFIASLTAAQKAELARLLSEPPKHDKHGKRGR